ncbi:MAG: GNAT family N-acetyltransferase [Candidatus Syntrophoarchaeum sp.]|nr:GNAT family N-acetyltransferase [Candidatus Syntrophoarchaeum sp.]
MIRIRCFQSDDFKRVVEIAEEGKLNQDPMIYLELSKLFPDGFFVAEDRGVIVAFVISIMMLDGGGRIFAVAVSKSHRRRKIGISILNHALEEFRRKRVPYVQLEVRVDNFAAQKIYEKLGFEKEGIIPAYYSDGTDAILMKKYLQQSFQPHTSGMYV